MARREVYNCSRLTRFFSGFTKSFKLGMLSSRIDLEGYCNHASIEIGIPHEYI
jgi:hypothetical protein